MVRVVEMVVGGSERMGEPWMDAAAQLIRIVGRPSCETNRICQFVLCILER